MTRAEQLSVFADQDPDNPDLLCDLLDELFTAGDVQGARARLKKVAPGLLQLSGVQFRVARCALLQGDFSGAAGILEALCSQGIPPAGVVHDLAFVQLKLGEPARALQTLAGVPTTGEDVVAFALLRARALHHLRDHAAALDTLAPFEDSMRQAEICGVRALLWLDHGDNIRAAIEADRALRLDIRQHEAAIVRGTLALWEQRVDTSSEVFEQILAEHPDSGRALLGLGQDFMLRGNIPAGRGLLERATAEMPEHLGSWHALAWCQLIEGDLAGAKHSFDKAFAVDRTFGETHGGIALVHALRSERREAEESIKRAMRLDPQGRSARYAKSVLLLDEGQVEEARRIIDDILKQSPRGDMAMDADFIFKLRELVRPRG
jgi:Tfp pilus assembly protein PilF